MTRSHRSKRRRSIPLAVLLLLASTGSGPAPRQAPQRLAYTITFLGVPVARALLEEVRGATPAASWMVRGSARTTSFWETFFHIGDAYTTRVAPGTFLPAAYERRIDEKGRRYRRIEWYGRDGGETLERGGLPPVAERYEAEGDPERVVVEDAPQGRHNLFSALWRMRYTSWEEQADLTLPLWVDGAPWELRMQRHAVEERKAVGERIRTWVIACRFRRLGPDPEGDEDSADKPLRDYVTQELVRQDAVVTFWIETEGARRPIAVEVKRPGITVKGILREPYQDERLP